MTTRRKIPRKPPKVGCKFAHQFKGKVVTMTIVGTRDGIGYEVRGKVFGSPSTAAKHISGHEENGYRFWHME
jgi:hypothetical protein